MKTTLPLALLAALLLGLLVYLRGGAEPPSEPAGTPAPTRPEPAPDVERPAPVATGPSLREEVAAAVPAPAVPVEAVVVPSAEERTGALVQLLGRVVVADAEGTEHRFEDGRGQLVVWLGDSGTYEDVEVVGGTFELPVPSGARVAPGTFHLGGRTAVVEGPTAPAPLPADGVLELRTRWPGGVLLHVVSEASGQELADVELWVDEHFPFMPATRHPGPRARQRTAAAPSPLAVEPYAEGPGYRRSLVHARAPGHAWGWLVVDHDRGGDVVLTLPAAGALDVHLVGSAGGASLRLRTLREVDGPAGPVRIEGPVVAEVALTDQQHVPLESLAPATYLVRVELGEPGAAPLVLGEAEVELPVGQRASVALTLSEVPQVELVSLSGTLDLPAAWNLEPWALTLGLVDEPLAGQQKLQLLDLEPRADGLLAWDAGEVQAGSYVASLMKLQHRMAFEVPAGDPVVQHLVVPPPARVVLEAVDAASGEPAAVPEVQWHIGAGVLGSTTVERATADPETGAFELFVAPGEVFVAPFGGGYVGEAERFVAAPGTNRWTLEVTRALGFRVVLRDAGDVVPPPKFGAMTQAQRLDGPGTSTLTTRVGSALEYQVPEPGRYRVQLYAPDGYLAPAPLEVEVAAGTFDEHLVELQRGP